MEHGAGIPAFPEGVTLSDIATATPLLQSAKRGSTELDISFCREVSFVETLDLSGPRLILKFDDSYSILRNIMKIKQGDVLTCVINDVMHKSKLNFTGDFQIMSMPVEGEVVTLNCLLKAVADMKIPAVQARLFSKSVSVQTVLAALAQGLSCKSTIPALLSAYHLLPGERPSLVLRQLAIEHGAVVYIDRGLLCLGYAISLETKPTSLTLHYKNPKIDDQILDYTHINSESLVSDRILRKYTGFNIKDGFIQAPRYGNCAPETTSADNIAVMDNLSTIAIPILDIITTGSGEIKPGVSLKFEWNMDVAYKDVLSDESLPGTAYAGAVVHYSAGASNYFCRIKAMQTL